MEADLGWFDPLPKQLQLVRSQARETVYAGGFGSGKTLSGGFKCLLESVRHPGTVGLVGRQTYRSLEDTTKRVMLDGDDKPPIIAPQLVSERSESDNLVDLVNGSRIYFRSLEDHASGKLRSLNLGWFYVDEATESTLKLWLELLGRLRHPAGPGRCWATTNPNGHDWLWQRFHPDSSAREPESFLIHAPTEENTHLQASYVTLLRRQPAEWVKRYVDASFDVAAGMIWEEWQREIHVVPESIVLGYDWRRFESLDHGRRNPTAYLQWCVDPDGFCLVEDEYYAPGLVSQHAAALAVKRGARSWGAVVADRQVFTADAYGNTPAAEYAKHGIAMVAADMDVSAGLLRVSELLLRDPARTFPDWHPWAGTLGPDGLGSPLLFVSERCQHLIGEVPQYVWRDLSPTMEERLNQPEEPRKLNDHACDALRYGAMTRPRPYARPGETSRAEPESENRGRAISAGVLERQF